MASYYSEEEKENVTPTVEELLLEVQKYYKQAQKLNEYGAKVEYERNYYKKLFKHLEEENDKLRDEISMLRSQCTANVLSSMFLAIKQEQLQTETETSPGATSTSVPPSPMNTSTSSANCDDDEQQQFTQNNNNNDDDDDDDGEENDDEEEEPFYSWD